MRGPAPDWGGVDGSIPTGNLYTAARFFSPPEVGRWGARNSEQVRRFYQLWTLKEAYVKACGLGLSLPVDWITFTIDGDQVTASLDARLDDDVSAWRFARFSPTSRHHVAMAVRSPSVAVWTMDEPGT